jgi:hypothetical protein
MAFCFLQHQRLQAAGRGKKEDRRATAAAEPAGDPRGHRPAPGKRTLTPSQVPALPTMDHVATP